MRLIIDRYLIREVALTFLAVSLLLTLMLLSTTFITLATETLEGDYPVSFLFTLLALKGVGNVASILPFALFIAVLLALGRLYRDNEVVVLMACGAGPERLLGGVAALALIVSLGVGYLTLSFSPWVAELSKRLLDEAGARQEIEGVVPGRFNTFGDNSPTVYVERYEAREKLLHGIFVQGTESLGDKGRPQQYVVKAARGYERLDPGGARYLILQDGYRIEGKPGQRDYRITRFAEHGILIQAQPVVPSRRPNYAIPTSRLWKSDKESDIAELHWRLATPISTFLLALLAVPLSRSSPRRGRYAGIFLGIFLYVFYNNLLTMGRSALSRGDLPPLLGLWWVHLLLLGLVAFLVWRQQRVCRWRLGENKR